MMKGLKTKLKKILAVSAFCMSLSISTTAMADEGTVTVASAKIRASADSGSEQLGSVAQGGKVDIISETTGADGKKWYQVFVNANVKGYIRADLVDYNGSSNTTDSTTSTTTEPAATSATAIEAKKGTVITSNVRIRKGASTSHGVVATANRGMVVTVTGEADGADGKKWYQISFTYDSKEITGFIRSDLVTFDNVPQDTAVSEITGTEEAPEAAQTEEAQQNVETQAEQQDTSSNNNQDIILMNVEETPYVMPGFKAVNLKWNEQDIDAYNNGKFYLFYAQQQNGEEGWFVFDSEKGVYQRYVYATPDVELPEEKAETGNVFVIIILVVVILVLLAAIALMFLKLRENAGGYSSYDDDDDDSEDEDLEDLEELEELADEQEARRAPRPQQQSSMQGVRNAGAYKAAQERPVSNGQPARRPVNRPEGAVQGMPGQTRRPVNSNQGMGAQPVRRPQPAFEGDGVVRRRPESEAGVNARPQSGRPMPNGQMPVRRPNPNGQPMQQRPQNVQPQGHRTKSFLENDDDIDQIDI